VFLELCVFLEGLEGTGKKLFLCGLYMPPVIITVGLSLQYNVALWACEIPYLISFVMGPSSTGVTGLRGFIKLCEMYVTVTISTSMTHRALDNITHDNGIWMRSEASIPHFTKQWVRSSYTSHCVVESCSCWPSSDTVINMFYIMCFIKVMWFKILCFWHLALQYNYTI